ncbi:MAG: MBL fold metallo-hydrolase [Nitrospirales bacterium]|nr:MBL fold metallo-hydrolase [Nitrospirales bacterium]
MPLEDDFCDIVKKARLGQGQLVTDIARQANLSAKAIESLEQGDRLPSAEEVEAVGQALALKPQALTDIVLEGWRPATLPSWVDKSIVTILGDIGGYEVKGYIVHDRATKQAVLIDTGYNPEHMLAELNARALTLVGICLTHGHTDHAGGLDRILAEWPVPVYLGNGDSPLLPWKPAPDVLVTPCDAQSILVGHLTVECLTTPGHTPGGICYRVYGYGQDLCFVGDTLFAGSIGRSNPFSLYSMHIKSVRQIVLQLPEDTILLPGHGPATTVREELRYNPFG